MGSSDGNVIGTEKILNNGPNDNRCNIVLVAEGFRDSEQDVFNRACNDFVSAITIEPWFPFLGSAINIHRLNVSSNESGADEPEICGDGRLGSGRNVATFFDARFCYDNELMRLLHGDSPLVKDTVVARVPEMHLAAVLVNSTRYGGSGPPNPDVPVFWTSLNMTRADWRHVLLHEMGHAVGLGDEYDCYVCNPNEVGQDHAPPDEPSEPNITTVTDRNALKWKHFVTHVPIPTMQNPNCTRRDTRANILDNDLKIGLFEGAMYYHCGRYRPAYNCRMRMSSQPFCRICIETIANSLIDFEGWIGLPFMDIENLAILQAPWRSQVNRNGVRQVTVANKGDGELRWRIIPGDNTHFRIASRLFSWQRLQGNSRQRVEILFNPPREGWFTDHIRVESNFQAEDIILFGEGYVSNDDLVHRDEDLP